MYVRVLLCESLPLRLGPHHEGVHRPSNARLRATRAPGIGTRVSSHAARPLQPLVTEANGRRVQQRQVRCRRPVEVHRGVERATSYELAGAVRCTARPAAVVIAVTPSACCRSLSPLARPTVTTSQVCQLSTYQRRAQRSKAAGTGSRVKRLGQASSSTAGQGRRFFWSRT